MKWPLVFRRRLEAVDADRERLRAERDQFAKDRDTQRAVAESATRQFTTADDELSATRSVNARLARDNASLREELDTYRKATPSDWQAKYEAEKKRADRLQTQWDDLLNLNSPEVAEGAKWQDRREQKMRYDA
jgi:hypothetical protein